MVVGTESLAWLLVLRPGDMMVCDVGGEKEHGAGGNALFGHGVRHSVPCLWWEWEENALGIGQWCLWLLVLLWQHSGAREDKWNWEGGGRVWEHQWGHLPVVVFAALGCGAGLALLAVPQLVMQPEIQNVFACYFLTVNTFCSFQIVIPAFFLSASLTKEYYQQISKDFNWKFKVATLSEQEGKETTDLNGCKLYEISLVLKVNCVLRKTSTIQMRHREWEKLSLLFLNYWFILDAAEQLS